jgi:folate-dependent phosphoribosylglycinamide formyltransferase PurN
LPEHPLSPSAEARGLRVVALCCEGPYQRHLIRRAAEEFQLVGVVLQEPPPQARGSLRSRLGRYRRPRTLVRYLEARLFLPPRERRAEALRQRLCAPEDSAPFPPAGAALLRTSAINAPEVVDFLRTHRPDLVLVNGTQLLRAPVLELLPTIRLGIINLHTGLSPYSRGANCNLYMVLEGHPEWVGVTVHHIDAGIDSGDIILSAQVPPEPDDDFETLDVRTFHVGIERLIEAAHLLAAGRAQRVPQWEKGKLFLRRTGYDYELWQRLAASRRMEGGMVRDYLADRARRDAAVRVVGPAGVMAP